MSPSPSPSSVGIRVLFQHQTEKALKVLRGSKPTMSPLEKIPPEIVLAITDYVPRSSMNSLCRASKRFHQVVNPPLYRAAIRIPHFLSVTTRDGKLDTLKVAASVGADLNRVYWAPAPSWSLLCWDGDDSDSGDGDESLFRYFGFTPIHEAQEGAVLPSNRDIGYCWASPLHLAAAEGHGDMVEWLLSQGVDLDVPGKLFCPCSSVSEVMVEPAPFSRSILSSGTWTPLHYAICRGHSNIALSLIDNGASMEVRYPWSKDIPRTHGIDQLFGLSPHQSTFEIRQTLDDILNYYLDANPDPHEEESDDDEENEDEEGTNDEGQTDEEEETDDEKNQLLSEQYRRRCLQYNMSAIHCAALSNEPEILRRLVERGISVNTADGCGANILHYAVESRSLDMVRCTLLLQADPSASLYIVDRENIKHRVEDICQWVARFCPNNNADYLDAVIVILAEHGGDYVFWQRPDLWHEEVVDMNGESSSDTEDEDVEYEYIPPKSMTINIITKHMDHDVKDFAQRGWVSQLLKGAIATHQPNNGFNDLKKEVMAFFWRVISERGCGAAALEMISQAYDSLDLTELIDGELPLLGVKTNYDGQVGTAALHMLLTDYKVYPVRSESEIAMKDKVVWLLEHGADPVDKFHQPAEFAALPCFLSHLNACHPKDFLESYFPPWNMEADDFEVVSRVADMMRTLGKHGAWEMGEGETQQAARTWDTIVRKIERRQADTGKELRKVILPSRVSAML